MGGTIGLGISITNGMTRSLGLLLGTLAGAAITAGIALVIYVTVDQILKRRVARRRSS